MINMTNVESECVIFGYIICKDFNLTLFNYRFYEYWWYEEVCLMNIDCMLIIY